MLLYNICLLAHFVLACKYGETKLSHGKLLRRKCLVCVCYDGSLNCATKCDHLDVKAGTCPKVDTPSVDANETTCDNSTDECYSDYQCAGPRKCCSDGCKNQCTTLPGNVLHV